MYRLRSFLWVKQATGIWLQLVLGLGWFRVWGMHFGAWGLGSGLGFLASAAPWFGMQGLPLKGSGFRV